MEKRKYVTPSVEEVELQGEVMMQVRSMGADVGIGYGGNASDNFIDEADVNSNNGWDLW